MPDNLKQPTEFLLKRYPKSDDRSLLAWSAADELLIEHLSQLEGLSASNILIVNDQFGAITTSLNHLSPTYWSDSLLSNIAIKQNLQRNTSEVLARPLNYQINNTHQLELSPIPKFDLVIFRVPKHNSLLAYQLEQIKPWLNDQAVIVSSGMTKEIHNNNLKIYTSRLGKTTTSLAQKKARLIFTQVEHKTPSILATPSYNLKKWQLDIIGLPGVFAREKLDIGTQVLLQYLPETQANDNLLDLGCGNGVIGAVMAKSHPKINVMLCDESRLAIESARLNFQTNQLTNGTFIQSDAFEQLPKMTFQHILCNPPFHQQNAQTIDIAHKMFKQSAKHLDSNGELRIVANRHLRYAPILKQHFKSVESISKNSKFSVWSARQPK